MALATPELSLGTGLAVGVVAYSVFESHLPPMVDVRTCDSGNRDIHNSVKVATWTAAGAVAAISLIAKDATVFILGGAVTIALAWSYHHANHVSPLTGRTGVISADDIVGSQQDSLSHGGGYVAYDAVI